MTIEKGQTWGAPGALPDDGVVVRTDAEARQVVSEARRERRPLPTLGLLGGDLCRTLGGLGDEARLRSTDAMTFPIDLGLARFDDREECFVAHLIARRSWWWGRTVAVMNAQWLGTWDLGPRSHPNDGLLDVTDGALPIGDRLQARRRLSTGTHLPHPALTTSRVASCSLRFDRGLDVWLDGEKRGRVKALDISCEPDALRVVV